MLSEQDQLYLAEISERRQRVQEEQIQAYREDIADWISALFDLTIQDGDLIDSIANGSVLCKLANLIEKAEADTRELVGDGSKAPYVIKYRENAAPGSFLARDNLAGFIKWTRHRGIKESVLFETSDLVERKNEKNVLYCLMDVARHSMMRRLPRLVELEREIEQLEKEEAELVEMEPEVIPIAEAVVEDRVVTPPAPEPEPPREPTPEPDPQPDEETAAVEEEDIRSHSHSISLQDVIDTKAPADEVDEAIVGVAQEFDQPIRLKKLRPGTYLIAGKKIFVRILRKHVMVRVGGGWDTLLHYLVAHERQLREFNEKITDGYIAESDAIESTEDVIRNIEGAEAASTANAELLKKKTGGGLLAPPRNISTESLSPKKISFSNAVQNVISQAKAITDQSTVSDASANVSSDATHVINTNEDSGASNPKPFPKSKKQISPFLTHPNVQPKSVHAASRVVSQQIPEHSTHLPSEPSSRSSSPVPKMHRRTSIDDDGLKLNTSGTISIESPISSSNEHTVEICVINTNPFNPFSESSVHGSQMNSGSNSNSYEKLPETRPEIQNALHGSNETTNEILESALLDTTVSATAVMEHEDSSTQMPAVMPAARTDGIPAFACPIFTSESKMPRVSASTDNLPSSTILETPEFRPRARTAYTSSRPTLAAHPAAAEYGSQIPAAENKSSQLRKQLIKAKADGQLAVSAQTAAAARGKPTAVPTKGSRPISVAIAPRQKEEPGAPRAQAAPKGRPQSSVTDISHA